MSFTTLHIRKRSCESRVFFFTLNKVRIFMVQFQNMKKALRVLIILIICAICAGIIYSVLNAMSLKPVQRPIKTYTYDTSYSPTPKDTSFSREEILATGQRIGEYSACEYITINGARVTKTGPNAGGCSSDYFYSVRPIPEVPQNDSYGTEYNIAMEIKDRNMSSENNFNTLKALLEESSCNKNTLLEFANRKADIAPPEPFAILACLGDVKVYKKPSMRM